MPFLFPYKDSNIEKNRIKNNTKIKRKEHDSVLAHHKKCFLHTQGERASVFTFKASMTIEATLAAPIFFFAAICFVYLLELMSLQTTIRAALHTAGRELAAESYRNTQITSYFLEEKMVEVIGKERLDNSMIKKGSKGFNYDGCKKLWNAEVLDLSVRYQVEFPVAMFRIPVLQCEERIRVKEWKGYSGIGFGTGSEEKVYITDTGLVYHEDAHCTYLDLSVHAIDKDTIGDRKNIEGKQYLHCEWCVWEDEVADVGQELEFSKVYYITNVGERFHNSLECRGLKRTVYAVYLSEIPGRSGCTRCVK